MRRFPNAKITFVEAVFELRGCPAIAALKNRDRNGLALIWDVPWFFVDVVVSSGLAAGSDLGVSRRVRLWAFIGTAGQSALDRLLKEAAAFVLASWVCLSGL